MVEVFCPKCGSDDIESFGDGEYTCNACGCIFFEDEDEDEDEDPDDFFGDNNE